MEQKTTARKSAKKWLNFTRKKSDVSKKEVKRKDVEKGDLGDNESGADPASPKIVETETPLKQAANKLTQITNVSIERGKLGNVSFDVDIDELMNLLPNLHDMPFCDTMPIAYVDYSVKSHFGMKAGLRELIDKEIQEKLSDKGPFHTMFERLIAKMTVDNHIEKERVKNNYKQKMKKAVQLLDNKRLLHLMDLYSFDLPVDCPNNFEAQRQELKFQSNKRFGEGMKLIFDNLKTSSSDLYNNFLLQILESNNLSTANLSDEHCLFSTRFNYAKVTLNSLKEAIKLYFPEKKGLENKTQQEHINKEKEHDSKVDVRFSDLIRFDPSGGSRKHYYSMLLDETAFVTVAVVRDLLVFMSTNIVEKHDNTLFDSKHGKGTEETHGHRDHQGVGKHLAHDTKVHEFAINKVPLKLPQKDDKFYTGVRNKLNAFVKKMKDNDVLQSNSVLESENLVQQVWDHIIKTLKELNSEDMAYIVETRNGRARQLHHSAAFIARKYLYKLVCSAQSSIVIFLTNTYNHLPSNWASKVQMLKMKMDILIDNAFVHHLKDNAITILSLVGLRDIKLPDFGRRISDTVETTNIRDILSQLITLIKYKMLVGVPHESPLYENMVSEMRKYLDEIRSKEMFNEVQVQEEARNVIAVETSDIIEREMLLRYMYIQPQLECLQQVAKIGADLVLEIAMKRSVRDV